MTLTMYNYYLHIASIYLVNFKFHFLLYHAHNKFGNHYTYGTYMNGNFNTCIGKLKMKYLPHDGRHTFASLMDSAGANDVCIKLIMGHSMKNDTTKGTYTHKTLEELLTEVNKI